MIGFDQERCRDLETSLSKEWLETNGLGGFASSTITGMNTRRYHGLLTAWIKPPVGRVVLLSKLEETLIIDGRSYQLSVNQYSGATYPQGHQYLKQFRLDPFPVFIYEVEGIEVAKSILMIHGENSTVIQYELKSPAQSLPPGCFLQVRPLIAFRDYHATTHENGALNRELEAEPDLVTIRPYEGLPSLHLAHHAELLDRQGWWYRNFEYQAERERGLDFREDLFSPCALNFDLSRSLQAAIIASTERRDISRVADYRQAEIDRRRAAIGIHSGADEFVRLLVSAADQYLITHEDRQTVIAGYHWFGDWGRDTMIALPGLTLVTGRVETARSILLTFARFVDRGMLPNRFPEAGEEPEYNTVDATLWYFEAVRALLQYTGDYQFVRSDLYPVLTEIIDWHVRGTRYGIQVDEDGLLQAGEPGVQLTWMDAKVGDWVVTPRTGKPVEIQALWYNALRVMEHLAHEFGDHESEQCYHRMAARTEQSFNRLFWNEAAGCLFDVIEGERRDGSIRPNQILAVSLPHTMVSREKARQVVEVVERQLLTPYGLRTLSPNDPQYRGRYGGGPVERDGAYHQGTVWPWLMGPFITAYLKVNGRTEQCRRQAMQWLGELHRHFHEAGLGQVSEIFDGDAPHQAGGCVAQAWSVAELLRAAVEEIYSGEDAKHANQTKHAHL